MRNVTALALALALIATPMAAFAQRGDGPGGGKGLNMTQTLQLTDAQRSQMRILRAEEQKTMIRLRAEVEVAVIDFHAELQKATPDDGELTAMIEKIVAAKSEVERARLAGRVKMMNVLTPEQKGKMADQMSQRTLRSGGPGGGGPGAGPGGGPGGPDDF